MIMLIGAEGSMGCRYRAILNYIGKESLPIDLGHTNEFIFEMAARSDGIIIASPTDTHVPYLKLFRGLKKPILCEKPFTKDIEELEPLMREYQEEKWPLSMMYQYSILASTKTSGLSYYNYFKHGSDGLAWDCLQIIGLANGKVELEETSPEWRCSINGEHVHYGTMDIAYIQYVRRWLMGINMDPVEILNIHQKTHLVAESMEDG